MSKKIKPVCGNCNFCIQDDGSPYCILKDLYTSVKLDDVCDECDMHGQLWFTAKKQKGE